MTVLFRNIFPALTLAICTGNVHYWKDIMLSFPPLSLFFFSALVSPSLKAGKEKAFNENFATSALNLFCSSFKKLSPKAEETAAPAQAALWAVSHLLWSTSLAYRQQPGSMETPGTG